MRARKPKRCANCGRERVAADVFWHAQDRKWYCAAGFDCEARLEIIQRRLAAGASR